MRRPVAVALAAALTLATGARERRHTEAEKRQQQIAQLSRELARRNSVASPSPEQLFLHARAAALLERLRAGVPEAYVFERLAKAAEDLLEASEDIEESRQSERAAKPGDREETARQLQRSYFRVQQADYFASFAQESAPASWVKHCRALYQQACSAWDAQRYRKARKLAQAASNVVGALEKLVQARASGLEPPRLP
ncbi:MAG: hypothetical protein ACP5U2_02920 [Bryobacteraceae bacterium]